MIFLSNPCKHWSNTWHRKHQCFSCKCILFTLIYPVFILAALLSCSVACICIDTWTTLSFLITCCGMCGKKSHYKMDGSFFYWSADMGNLDNDMDKKVLPTYSTANGRVRNANEVGTEK